MPPNSHTKLTPRAAWERGRHRDQAVGERVRAGLFRVPKKPSETVRRVEGLVSRARERHLSQHPLPPRLAPLASASSAIPYLLSESVDLLFCPISQHQRDAMEVLDGPCSVLQRVKLPAVSTIFQFSNIIIF